MSSCDNILHLMNDWVPLVRLCWMTNSPTDGLLIWLVAAKCHTLMTLKREIFNFVACKSWQRKRERERKKYNPVQVQRFLTSFTPFQKRQQMCFRCFCWVSSRFSCVSKSDWIKYSRIEEINAFGLILWEFFFLDDSWSDQGKPSFCWLTMKSIRCRFRKDTNFGVVCVYQCNFQQPVPKVVCAPRTRLDLWFKPNFGVESTLDFHSYASHLLKCYEKCSLSR